MAAAAKTRKDQRSDTGAGSTQAPKAHKQTPMIPLIRPTQVPPMSSRNSTNSDIIDLMVFRMSHHLSVLGQCRPNPNHRQRLGDGLADAAAAAGHQRTFALQLQVH